MNTYSDQIFQSIDQIISQRLNEVSFDRTEICTIVNQDTKDKNKYWVTNEAGLKYQAYTLDSNIVYAANSRIYVTIPQGDYSAQKIILGYCTNDKPTESLYTNPFENLISLQQLHWITNDICKFNTIDNNQEFSVNAYTDNETTDSDSFVNTQALTFHSSGLGQINYIGLEFAATTGFGGTQGEFQIIVDLLDNNHTSLLTTEELGMLTLSSRQLYGNPYYLTNILKFQHLFPFPVGSFNDLSKVKYIQVTLRAKGNFNYKDTGTAKKIIINDLSLYFGFDVKEESLSNNNVVLDLDYPMLTDTNRNWYTTEQDQKIMSIDWFNNNTGAIYNETEGHQYPVAGEYTIYWLQYSEAISYKKRLETTKPIIDKCWNSNQQRFNLNLNNTFKRQIYFTTLEENNKPLFDEFISLYDTNNHQFITNIMQTQYEAYIKLWLEDCWHITLDGYTKNINERFQYEPIEKYDPRTFSSYLNLWDINEQTFYNKTAVFFIDIEESGPFWKTIKRLDAAVLPGDLQEVARDPYTHILNPISSWPKEQIKVLIKHKDGTFIESNGLTFNNTEMKPQVGITQSMNDTLKFTLANGDDGIYNNYGIDNKLLNGLNLPHSITVDFIDNTKWDPSKQRVIWEMPRYNSMLTVPLLSTPDSSGTVSWIQDKKWETYDNIYAQFSALSEYDAKTVYFGLNEQFSLSRTNNTINCIVERYTTSPAEGDLEQIYRGSITFQFGTQGTSGTTYAFNIYPETPGTVITIDPKDAQQLGFYRIGYNNLVIDRNRLQEECYWVKDSLYGEQFYSLDAADRPDILITAANVDTFGSTMQDPIVYEKKSTWLPEEQMKFTAILENLQGEVITPETYKDNVTWSYIYGDREISAGTSTLEYIVSPSTLQTALNGLPSDAYRYFILKATVTGITDNNLTLSAYYPLTSIKVLDNDVKLARSFSHSGANRIVYNAAGVDPNWNNMPYALYHGQKKWENNDNIKWEIRFPGYDNAAGGIWDNYPKLDDKNCLIPTAVAPNKPLACAIVGTIEQDVSTTIEAYYIPLIFVNNVYSNTILNNWDGSLVIDEKGKYILSQLMGAGVKNADNSFTGVVFGQVGADFAEAHTGLYGLNAGQLRYKLDDEGAFYVGSDNDNFISFNEHIDGRSGENELIIKCQNFVLVTQSLELDSSKSSLTIWGKDQERKLRVGRLMQVDSLGYIWSEDENGDYGLQIWNGAIEIYGPPKNDLMPQLLCFDQNEEALIINGIIKRHWALSDLGIAQDGAADLILGTIEDHIELPTGAWSGTSISNQYQPIGITINNSLLDDQASATLQCTFGAFLNGYSTTQVMRDQCGIYLTAKADNTYIENLALTLLTNATVYTDINKQKGAPIYLTVTPQNATYHKYITWQVFETTNGELGCQCTGRSDTDSEYSFLTSFTADGQPQGIMRGNWTVKDGELQISNSQFTFYQGVWSGTQNPVGVIKVHKIDGYLEGNWSSENDLSDIRIKHDVESLPEAYDILFDALKPSRYKYNHGTSNRYHTGYIAQEVVEAIKQSGLTTQDFAGVMLYPNINSELSNSSELWHLRRDEFVSLNTWQIQKLKTRVTQLEQEIKELKNEI